MIDLHNHRIASICKERSLDQKHSQKSTQFRQRFMPQTLLYVCVTILLLSTQVLNVESSPILYDPSAAMSSSSNSAALYLRFRKSVQARPEYAHTQQFLRFRKSLRQFENPFEYPFRTQGFYPPPDVNENKPT
ncbi:hypothetical protein Ddc_01907 [Ditylenchus destructor]|nr:hypothetical protein Ddc_01907 [Ditylenchus destructor]